MNNRTIIASAGLAMLSLSAVSIIGLSSGSSVQAQSPQSNQNSDTTAPVVVNATIDDVKQQLHAQLDGAIMAAQNNDTFGVLMGLSMIAEGLAAINNPSYFIVEGPLPNNGTTLANTSETTTATGSNQGRTTTTTTSAASPNN
ncbi:MAG: hypothetical protein M3288_09740 [Thermoproteota archaeon]|nr:hypothetical protein [Thermoproteota archaeon]